MRAAVTTPFSLADGRFQLRRQLGSGASGTVYDAVDLLENRIVAIKVLRDVERAFRFREDFRQAAELCHPNVVRLFGHFQDGKRCFFTMELVEGLPVVDYVRGLPPRELRPLSVEEYARTKSVLGQVIEGVTALHTAGMLHGDLKPANVLVSDAGRVSIVDLSLVRDLRMPSSHQPNVGGGTPLYLAPEVLSDSAPSRAADWYSVGVMIYELLRGRLPFAGSWLQVLSVTRDYTAVLPHGFDRQEPLAMLCVDLLQRDPGARPTGVEIRDRFARLV